jgi:hypothetical protein
MRRCASTISAAQRALIEASRLFFVASADPAGGEGPQGQGPVNLSPKGGARLHVIDATTVAYLDWPGSGNETARHAAAGGSVTLMVMSMDAADAAIVRLYGRAGVCSLAASPHAARLITEDPGLDPDVEGRVRQVVTVEVQRTQTSCGYGVPVYEYVGERQRAQRGRRFK